MTTLIANKSRKPKKFHPIVLFFIIISGGLLLGYSQICIMLGAYENSQKVADEEAIVNTKNTELVIESGKLSQMEANNLEKQRLINNITHVEFSANNKDLCDTKFYKRDDGFNENVKIILIIVQTRRDHDRERQIIRNSWGSIQPNTSWSVRVMFLMGLDPSAMLHFNYKSIADDPLLDHEISEYGDLVIGNFLDTDRNASYKTLSGFEWVLGYCTNAEFVIVTNDDVFVDVRKFVKYREENLKSGTKENLYCGVSSEQKPVRCLECSYYVNAKEYPYEYYPTYCSGIGFGLTVDLIQKFLAVVHKASYFWISDVFVTGILRELAEREFPDDINIIIKDLWKDDIATSFDELKAMCQSEEEERVRYKNANMKSLISVPKNDFAAYIKCLFKTTNSIANGDVSDKTKDEV